MGGIGLAQSPEELASQLEAVGCRRAYLVRDAGSGAYRASHPLLEELARAVAASPDQAGHEAVFLQVAQSAPTLLAAFVHSTRRGQAQGGLRRRPYPNLDDLLRDGLRLSRAMTRKSALAGLWWGGGKGILCDVPGLSDDLPRRAALYREYGAFVSSLGGCYVTAEDAGTTPSDMAEVFSRTRFATCIPPSAGGSGNPARATAAGVERAMEAALAFRGEAGLEGRRVVIQGAGHVGSELALRLLAAGAGVLVGEVDAAACAALAARWEGPELQVRRVEAGDRALLAEPCDVLAPCALGGVLDADSIAGLRASVVCGAANNPLADEERGAQALAARDILYVPDFVANCLGIVQCANEQYGSIGVDAATAPHLEREAPGGVYQTTLRVLELARAEGIPTTTAAARLADQRAEEPHPIWGHRGLRIIESLVDAAWERDAPG